MRAIQTEPNLLACLKTIASVIQQEKDTNYVIYNRNGTYSPVGLGFGFISDHRRVYPSSPRDSGHYRLAARYQWP